MTESEIFAARAKATPAEKAPYTFVPTGNKTLPSPIENLDLSRPVKDALSGYLQVSWQNETEMLVGGGNANDPEDEANTLPLKVDDKYAIPGSTLKGLIRANMEISSFARLSFIDDYAAYTRNFNDVTWKAEVNLDAGGAATGGWLFRTCDGYKIVEASKTLPIHFDDLFGLLTKFSASDWHLADMHARLTEIKAKNLNGIRNLSDFDATGSNFDVTGSNKARLVISGPTAEPGRGGQAEKTREFIFCWPDAPVTKDITKSTGDRFLASLNKDSNTHSKDPEANYSALIRTGGIDGFDPKTDKDQPDIKRQVEQPEKYGLPVFWRNPQGGNLSDCGKIPILSLTALLRVPFKKTVHDLIAKTQGGLDDDQLDLVQALLGWAPPETPTDRIANRPKTQKPLRSRVRFGFAFSDDAKAKTNKQTWAALKPKPSYWPYYLKANAKTAEHPVDYNNPAAILAGRKRYPARGLAQQKLPMGGKKKGTGEERTDMEQKLTFLEGGATFTSQIRFNNISPVELGALVWSITYGDLTGDQGLRHMIGRAKPHGYGQLKATITKSAINRLQSKDDAPDLQGAITAFTGWVTEQTETPFDQHPTIRILKGTAHAQTGKGLAQHLDFPKADGNKPDSETQGQKTINAYVNLKAQAVDAKHLAGKSIENSREVGLPTYPGAPKVEG